MIKEDYKDFFDFIIKYKKSIDKTYWLDKFKADLEKTDCCGRTVIQYAVYQNDLESTQNLINFGAKIDAKDDFGITPLHRAAFYNLVDMVRLLIELGADTNVVDNYNMTPLDLALSEKSQEEYKAFELFDITDFTQKKLKIKKNNHQSVQNKQIIIDLLKSV